MALYEEDDGSGRLGVLLRKRFVKGIFAEYKCKGVSTNTPLPDGGIGYNIRWTWPTL